jgi:hypothetical protein
MNACVYMHIQAAVTLAPQINERSRKMAESLDENSIARLTAPRRNFAHPPVKKPPKVSQADFDRRQRERNLKQRQIREAKAAKIRAEQLKEVRPPVNSSISRTRFVCGACRAVCADMLLLMFFAVLCHSNLIATHNNVLTQTQALTKRSLRIAEARRVQEATTAQSARGGGNVDGSGNWSRMASLTPRQQRWADEAQR